MNLTAVRCEALFVSALQQSDLPSVGQVRDAVVRAVRELGSAECAARVAQEFGDHPDQAVARMCWARRLVAAVYVWEDAYDEERQLLTRGVFAAGSY
jgi:hypothetical protein